MKAGGPNYVAQFMDFSAVVSCQLPVGSCQQQLSVGSCQLSASPPANRQLTTVNRQLSTAIRDQLRSRTGELGEDGEKQAAGILAAVLSYERHFREEFSVSHDHFKLVGQDNFRRYLPVPAVRVRVHPEDTAFELFARVCAGHIVGSRVTVSVPPQCFARVEWPRRVPWPRLRGHVGVSPPVEHAHDERGHGTGAHLAIALLEELTKPWAGAVEVVEESDDQLADAIRKHRADRVRYAAPDRVPPVVLQAAGESGVCVVSRPVLAEGRVELLWYLQEQSISIDYHRYGNLGARSGEVRTEPL
jgi:RHH-type proline utilization regulon transcriptional repressor/proline dehydrogenase/delta 1-pyrroline-5-carboxylate dehydrogenase